MFKIRSHRRVNFNDKTFTEHSNYFMYYMYVIRNRDTKETYIGYTDNLKRRINEHKNKNPELIYYEAYKDKRDAQNRERQLKNRGQSIRWLKSRVKYSLQE